MTLNGAALWAPGSVHSPASLHSQTLFSTYRVYIQAQSPRDCRHQTKLPIKMFMRSESSTRLVGGAAASTNECNSVWLNIPTVRRLFSFAHRLEAQSATWGGGLPGVRSPHPTHFCLLSFLPVLAESSSLLRPLFRLYFEIGDIFLNFRLTVCFLMLRCKIWSVPTCFMSCVVLKKCVAFFCFCFCFCVYVPTTAIAGDIIITCLYERYV